jgi:hypothetical protein
MKKAVILILVLMALLSLSCGKSKPPVTSGKRPYTIATIVKLDGIAWFERMRAGVKKFGDETGNKCFLLGRPRPTPPCRSDHRGRDCGGRRDLRRAFSVEALEPVLRRARNQALSSCPTGLEPGQRRCDHWRSTTSPTGRS